MTQYDPDWVSAPGDTIADILHERGLSEVDLAERTGLTQATVAALIVGDARVTADIARCLEQALGASVGSWLARERHYRERSAMMDVAREAMPDLDMTTITPADWTAIVRTAWENPDGKGCGRLYQLAYMARDHGRSDCVDIVAFRLFAAAVVRGVGIRDGVTYNAAIAPALTLLLLLRGNVVADRDHWLERIRREWSAETKAHPRVQREAVLYMDVAL